MPLAKTHKIVERITATREHPFYVSGKGFVLAGGLAVGNAIVTRAGPPLIVQSVKWSRRAEGYKVYNFEVQDDHSYFVGNASGGAWVHNTGVCPTGDVDPAAQALADRIDGQPSQSIPGFGNREFDAVSDEYIGQSSDSWIENVHNWLNKSHRNQIKATLSAAGQEGKTALFEFTAKRPPDEVIAYIRRHAEDLRVPYRFDFPGPLD